LDDLRPPVFLNCFVILKQTVLRRPEAGL